MSGMFTALAEVPEAVHIEVLLWEREAWTVVSERTTLLCTLFPLLLMNNVPGRDPLAAKYGRITVAGHTAQSVFPNRKVNSI